MSLEFRFQPKACLVVLDDLETGSYSPADLWCRSFIFAEEYSQWTAAGSTTAVTTFEFDFNSHLVSAKLAKLAIGDRSCRLVRSLGLRRFKRSSHSRGAKRPHWQSVWLKPATHFDDKKAEAGLAREKCSLTNENRPPLLNQSYSSMSTAEHAVVATIKTR
jgi:hypothetical protein